MPPPTFGVYENCVMESFLERLAPILSLDLTGAPPTLSSIYADAYESLLNESLLRWPILGPGDGRLAIFTI